MAQGQADDPRPFAIEQRGARFWVSVFRDVACRHAHPSAMSATRCGRHRRRDANYDRAVEGAAGDPDMAL
jgi:hypothetical protein